MGYNGLDVSAAGGDIHVAHRFPALIAAEALVAATRTAAETLGLDRRIGTVAEGKLAGLTIGDGDPLADPELLSGPGRVWLGLPQGVPVAGQALVNQGP